MNVGKRTSGTQLEFPVMVDHVLLLSLLPLESEVRNGHQLRCSTCIRMWTDSPHANTGQNVRGDGEGEELEFGSSRTTF
jgi:hypothetical protein